MPATATAIPILSDNYAWLFRDAATGFTAVVDPAELAPIENAIAEAGGRLDMILLTHHHEDHIAAVEPLRQHYRAAVVGAEPDAHRLPKLDLALQEGQHVELGDAHARVIDTPGHTIGHIAFFIASGNILFCGDTLFSLGCGRLLEGTAADMFASLAKLAVLPGETLVCCGHEYTQSNARFALTEDPGNMALRDRAAEVDRQRAAGLATVPTRLSEELGINPFLRASSAEQLAQIRTRKDQFR